MKNKKAIIIGIIILCIIIGISIYLFTNKKVNSKVEEPTKSEEQQTTDETSSKIEEEISEIYPYDEATLVESDEFGYLYRITIDDKEMYVLYKDGKIDQVGLSVSSESPSK